MSSLTQSLITTIDKFTELTGRLVAWLTLAMMLITCVVVIIRYGFSIGTPKLQESIVYLHAAVLLLGAAFTLKHDGHVRVDIFYRQFNVRQKAWVNALGAILLLLPVSVFIVFISFEFAANAWEVKEGSPNAGGIPGVYLLKTLIPITGITLALQGLSEVMRSSLLLVEEQTS